MTKKHFLLVKDTVAGLCIQANTILRPDIVGLIRKAARDESEPLVKKAYTILTEAIDISRKKKIPLCQDTGLPVLFVDIGPNIIFSGYLKQALIEGIRQGYTRGFLRSSIVHPLRRRTPMVIPPVVHFDFVRKKGLRISLLPKGFGSENKTSLRMFKPTAAMSDIELFIEESVRKAGASACPPFFIGVGIGSTADGAILLSKKALLADFRRSDTDPAINRLRKNVQQRLNRISCGVVGLPAKNTCLGVNALVAPTHIAGLPVGVSISCWVMRSATKTILSNI